MKSQKNFFKKSRVELDDDCNRVVFERFLLPDEWQRANPGKTFVPMMLIFPDQYPDLPTNGFYLPASLQLPPNATHFFDRGYGGAFGQTAEEMEFMRQGQWKWFCTHIKPGAWSPARLHEISDWRHGDNLWDIITLCVDVNRDFSTLRTKLLADSSREYYACLLGKRQLVDNLCIITVADIYFADAEYYQNQSVVALRVSGEFLRVDSFVANRLQCA